MVASPHRHPAAALSIACILSLAPVISPAHGQINLTGQVDLPRLVDVAAQRLGLRISYDEQSLKGKVTIRQERGLADDELWSFTNRVLAEQGFTTIRAGDEDSLAVVKLAGAGQLARVESLEDLRSNAGVRAGFRRVLITLQQATSKDVISAVQLVLSKPGGSVAESDQAGLLVIADLSAYLDVALRLIEQLDGPEGGAAVKLLPARNVDPARLAMLAKQLADKRKAVGGREIRGELLPAPGGDGLMIIAPSAFMAQWESIIASADRREQVDKRTYSTGSFGSREVATLIEQTVRSGSGTTGTGAGSGPGSTDDRWRIVFDDLTGTLIITATPAQHEQINELMQRLASVPAGARRPVRTFLIRNRGVKEVQLVIEDLMRAGVLDAQATAGADQPSAPGLVTNPASQTTIRSGTAGGSPVETSAPQNPSSSSWPLGPSNGSSGRAPRSGTSTSGLTLTADEATNTLIAVGEPRLLAQLEQLLPTLDVSQPQVMLEAFLVSLSDSQAVNLGVELQKLHISGGTLYQLSSLFGLSTAAGSGPTATRTVGDSNGLNGIILDPGNFSVVVKALETINHGRALSSPKLLVSNNQQATFNSVLQQPFATTNASTTVATTAFGGTQDAGTTISVKPQIAQGDHLTLTYSVALSSFTGAAANANLPPPRQQNTVQSVATIPDGYTVVVGGLENTNDGNGASQVPLVGNIPIIGELFKNRSVTQSRTRFYVFVRASVLRSSSLEGLKYLSDVDTSAAGIDDGWPVVAPRLIGGGR